MHSRWKWQCWKDDVVKNPLETEWEKKDCGFDSPNVLDIDSVTMDLAWLLEVKMSPLKNVVWYLEKCLCVCERERVSINILILLLALIF